MMHDRGHLPPDEALTAARHALSAAEEAVTEEHTRRWLVIAVRHYQDLDQQLSDGAELPHDWKPNPEIDRHALARRIELAEKSR